MLWGGNQRGKRVEKVFSLLEGEEKTLGAGKWNCVKKSYPTRAKVKQRRDLLALCGRRGGPAGGKRGTNVISSSEKS